MRVPGTKFVSIGENLIEIAGRYREGHHETNKLLLEELRNGLQVVLGQLTVMICQSDVAEVLSEALPPCEVQRAVRLDLDNKAIRPHVFAQGGQIAILSWLPADE
jgi:hypothetical protein